MIGYFRSRRALKRARAAYELARLQSLIDENRRRLSELEQIKECRYCKALEDPKQRKVCERQ
jgi:hypothetical protein